MKCLHCLVEFHDERKVTHINQDADGHWGIFRCDCPACKRMNLFLVNGEYKHFQSEGWRFTPIFSEIPIRPKGSNRPPPPLEVPPHISEDYIEACLVLPDSAKASAALSRRC